MPNRDPDAAPGLTARLDAAPPWALVLTAVMSVQFGAGVARLLFDDLGATGTLLLRLGFSAALLTAIVRPRVWLWSARAWGAVVALGVALAAMNLSFYLALRDIPQGVAVTVEFTGPLLLALAQTRRLVDAGWAAAAMTGVALLGLDTTDAGARLSLLGLGLAFLAGLFWAGYILASARVGQELSGLQGLSVALVVALVLIVPVGWRAAPTALADPRLLLGGLVVALMSSLIAYGLELSALRRMATRVFGILMSLGPAAAALSGWLVLGQRLDGRQLVALALVSAASVGVTLTGRSRRPPADTLPA